ncbi:patatin-like phospholipase family protein [Paralimibaculum aggregatum]|uniref:Patatin-like phospholipase family protein n=1 Tax=Paralimibaculum aggregatum TaxID=3036245 RepID=A0ABQ6LDV4_9RHOB|nr:patatin-like phospholipase family protein [Limibaculum sp. NKW23]GMG81540.1 patatin-like phospholipase family protein [Limibaculum sp. NKW23]
MTPTATRSAPGARVTLAGLRRLLARILGIGLLLAAAGCTTVLVRNAVPEDKLEQAHPYGIDAPLMRIWGDSLRQEDVDRVLKIRADSVRQRFREESAGGRTIHHVSLALSGGGPDGAFGAGLLAGWTARGDRPEFQVVTGVSTGAIIALFAFLGPDHDDTLREIYTTYSSKDLFIRTFFTGLTGGTALLDTRGYRKLIDRYITDEIVADIAEAYAEGRLLMIGTTNIDASRPVIWNIGAIAASGHADAKRLIQDVVQASSAIPAVFPPGIIPVEVDGKRYDEMHVDGGATQQVMLYSPAIRLGDFDHDLGVKIDRTVYVVINNKLEKPYAPVRPRLLSIAGTAASSLIGGSGSGDVYRIFAVAERDGLDLNITAIPTDFDAEPNEMFDPVYMTSLYQLGRQVGLDGNRWSPYPLDFVPAE